MTYGRRQVWLASIDETRAGTEIQGKRPCLILSHDIYNNGPFRRVVAVPLTTKITGIPFHVEVPPEEGGLKKRSFIVCDQVQSISVTRLLEPWGSVSTGTMAKVEQVLRDLLF